MNNRSDEVLVKKNRSAANTLADSRMGEASRLFINNRPEAVTQRKFQEAADKHTLQQPYQNYENNTGLPDKLKYGLENLSGYSLDDVRVYYNSDKPAQFMALAYAQGSEIHLGPGQEKHLPHEAWHVVQQKQGRVQPTMQMNGFLINADHTLEDEATSMGNRATQVQHPSRNDKVNQAADGNSEVIQPFWGWIVDKISSLIGMDQFAADLADAAMDGFAEAMLEMYPPPPPVFPNKQPQNLENEIRRYLNNWKATKGKDNEAFIISFATDNNNFRTKILTGQKFLWTYDTDGFLSIGSTEMNQHSVVGAGKDVYSAGTGQLVMSPEMESYLSFCYLVNVKAREYFNQREYEIAADFILSAKEFRSTPPAGGEANDTVELDFESGHYAPIDAWKKTYEAWSATGFKVVKSSRGGHI